MKKEVLLGLFLIVLSIFLFHFVSSATSTISITPITGESGTRVLYNITIVNDATNNLDNVSINFYGLNYNSSSLASNTGQTPISSGDKFSYNFADIIPISGTRSFWFNASEKNLGVFRINVTTLDDAVLAFTENKTITISDTINPTISFISPTPSAGSTIGTDYISFSVAANDTGVGIKNVTFYIHNSTELVVSQTDTTFPYLYNFTGLNDTTYYLNATTYDLANNSASTTTRTVIISASSSCTPSWTCTWGECVGGIQTQVNCVDANICNATAPTNTQPCDCVSNWACGNWTPADCSGNEIQTSLCTDLNDCAVPNTKTRTCVVTPAKNGNASGQALSSTALFFIVLGVIVVSVLGVFIALMKLKKKSSTDSNESDSGYPVYTPPRGPPPSPPAYPPQTYPPQGAYPQQRPVYPNSPPNY